MSEQLKDVPDELLMKEVQSPSGAYPSYLIVTEMGRRKRMRDQAKREMPTTTVTQDLMPPSREQMMMAAAAAQRQTMPPMAQPMSQPPQGLNAPGIMASPQAMNALAAQDVMGAQEPRRMAGGGMVSFAEGGDIKYDDRGVARFQNQGYVGETSSPVGRFFRGFMAGPEGAGERYAEQQRILARERELREKLQQLEGYGFKQQTREQQLEAENIRRQLGALPSQIKQPVEPPPVAATQADARRMDNFIDATVRPSAAPPAPPAVAGGGGRGSTPITLTSPTTASPLTIAPYVDPYATETKKNLADLRALREPTAEDIEQLRTAEEKRYGEKVPFRMGFLEQDIAKRQKDIEGRRGSNINEAIIQAGLGIMGSKSPYFAQAVSEGGLSALGAYRQGLKDIREGERDILQSRVALSNAQTLYDQGKFAAGEKAEERANKQYERGLNRLNTESAVLARNQAYGLQAYQADVQGKVAMETARQKQAELDMEREKLPATIDALRGQAAYYRSGIGRGGAGRLSDADQKAAEDEANRLAMMDKTVKYGTPEFIARRNQYYLQELQRRAAGLGYQPGGTPPAGGTGAEFIGFR